MTNEKHLFFTANKTDSSFAHENPRDEIFARRSELEKHALSLRLVRPFKNRSLKPNNRAQPRHSSSALA
jgi:hypothetical protein